MVWRHISPDDSDNDGDDGSDRGVEVTMEMMLMTKMRATEMVMVIGSSGQLTMPSGGWGSVLDSKEPRWRTQLQKQRNKKDGPRTSKIVSVSAMGRARHPSGSSAICQL